MFRNQAGHSADGAIHFICMDWRHLGEVLAAGKSAYAPSFLPVEVTTTEVSFPAEPVSADGAGRIEIALASGHRLTLSGAFDADVVLRLARGLAAP